MDANLEEDIIVVAGDTYDSGLTGVQVATFVAKFSISSANIYWAKGDTSKSGFIPVSVSLSPTATFVIVLINDAYLGSAVGFV